MSRHFYHVLRVGIFIVPVSLAWGGPGRQSIGQAFEGQRRVENKKPTVDEIYQKGLEAKKLGRWGDAKARFEQVLRQSPSHSAAKAQLKELAKRASTSKPTTKSQFNSNAKQTGRLNSQAEAAWKTGRWGDAQSLYRKILSQNPANRHAKARMEAATIKFREQLIRKAQEHERAGDARGAVDLYEAALQQEDDAALRDRVSTIKGRLAASNRKKSDDIYLNALAASQKGNNEKAFLLCRQALALDPGNIQAQRMLERLERRVR